MNTNYFLNMVAGHAFHTKTTPALPTKLYIGLSTSAPSADGSNVREPSGNGYKRVELTTLSTPTDGVVTNTSGVEFEESKGSWGTVTHFVIFDSQTGGNLLMYGALNVARSVETDTIMTIKSGSLELSVVNPGV